MILDMPYKDPEKRRQHYQENKEKFREKRKEYYNVNKIKILSSLKEYRKKNKEKIYKWQKTYERNHKKQLRIIKNKWAKKHPEYHKEWISRNPEKNSKYRKKYHNTHKENINKYYNMRKRKLGFIVIWKPNIITENMEYHHITKDFVVLIPKNIHSSIKHNIWTNKNMGKINGIAFKYILEYENNEYKK